MALVFEPNPDPAISRPKLEPCFLGSCYTLQAIQCRVSAFMNRDFGYYRVKFHISHRTTIISSWYVFTVLNADVIRSSLPMLSTTLT